MDLLALSGPSTATISKSGLKITARDGGWRDCLARFRRGDLDRVQLLASLEEKPIAGGARAAIEQVYPGMAWFKLDGQGIDNPENQFTAVWRHRASYISPVWQIDVPQWPRDPAGGMIATPVLRAWWLNSERSCRRSRFQDGWR